MQESASFGELIALQFRRIYSQVFEYLPTVLGALALLVVGVVVAVLLRFAVVRISAFILARLRGRRGLAEGETRLHRVPRLLGTLLFWFVLLFFLAAGIESLGISAVSAILQDLRTFLPDLLAATVVIVVSIVLADVARSGVHRAAARFDLGKPEFAARLVQLAIWTIAAMIAINQLGIESTALLILLAVLFGSAFGASALAFGLGAKSAVANIIASHYARKSYATGYRIRIDGIEGEIVEITRTHVLLKTPQERVFVPAHRFSEQIAHIVREAQ